MVRIQSHFKESKKVTKSLNYRFVSAVIGVLCMLQVVFLGLALAVSLYYKDAGMSPILITMGIMLVFGVSLFLIGRHSDDYQTGRRESMMTVTLSWFVVSLIGMLPYYLGGFVPSLSDAFFETISGFTTTGASVISDVEALPRSILLWRSTTQWEGGIGIIVFMVALVPMIGENASMVFNSEIPGVTHERFTPRIGVMAKWLIGIYVAWTALAVLLFWAGPMGLFDAVCHALTSISTGGFSTRNTSLSWWESGYTEVIAGVFMMAGAISFTTIYFTISRKDIKRLLRDSELKWFISLVAIFSLTGAVALYVDRVYGPNFLVTLRKSTVQVISFITSTGYAVGDYNNWGSFFAIIAVLAMYVSGCSGSTAGGLKVARLMVLIKSLGVELKKRTHPNAVVPVRVGGKAVDADIVQQVATFTFTYTGLIIIGALAISIEGYGFMESLVGAVSCVSNNGGSLGEIGPMVGFGALSAANKILLSILMVMGRLEIFTFLTILHPSFWRN